MKHRGDGLFSGSVQVANTLHVAGERIRPELHVRGGSWVRSVNAISTPVNDVPIYIPRNSQLISAHVVTQGGTGSCNIDVWKSSFADYPATSGNSITGGNNLVITSGTTTQNLTLTGWTTSINAGDVIIFHLNSSSTFTAIFVSLIMKETE